MSGVLVNIDVPSAAEGEAFYTRAFGLTVSRRFGAAGVELSGWPVKVHLLERAAGTVGAGTDRRRYERHWCPVHLDVLVEDLDTALARAVMAGARLEAGPRTEVWGRIATLADPFGHGLCLIQFLNRGYDEIAPPEEDDARWPSP
jgi:predicted enzyme related to lactoylglutathione lyase